MLGPASVLVPILPNVDYSTDGLIYSLHCTKTNSEPVVVITITGSVATFPPGAFVQGAVYHIYIKKLQFNSATAEFIGYKQIK